MFYTFFVYFSGEFQLFVDLYHFVFYFSYTYSILYFCNILLSIDRTLVVLVEIGAIIKLTPVTDNVTHVVVAPIRTTVSSDYNIEVTVLFFLPFFFDLWFFFLK